MPQPGTRCDVQLWRRAEFLPIFLNRAHAMRADRQRSSSLCSAPVLQGSLPPVAERADRCPVDAPGRPYISLCAARQSLRPGSRITRTNASTISRPLRVVATHAAEPETIFLGPVKDGQGSLLDKLVALSSAHAHRVAAAFQGQEELGSVMVLPRAGIHRAAPQPHNDRHVLNAHRALEFASAAGGALKCRLLRVVFAEQRLVDSRAQYRSDSRAAPRTISFGFSSLPVLFAGQCSVQRPHSTQE